MTTTPDHDRVVVLLETARPAIVRRWLDRVATAISSHDVDPDELENSVNEFLVHVAERLEQGDEAPPWSAAEHGEQRFRIGFRLSAMAREYGLLLEAIQEIAAEEGVELSMEEFGALSRLIVFGIAEAVSAYASEERHQREELAARHFAFVAHELRGPLQSMELAVDVLRSGAEPSGPIAVLARSLETLRDQIDHSLLVAQRRAHSEIPEPQLSTFDIVALLREAVEANAPHGQARGLTVKAEGPAETLEVGLDRVLVWSIVSNLIRNGIKFSKDDRHVIARVVPVAEHHIRLEVEDTCGGLDPETADKMFTPFAQFGDDRTGFGLGLAITQRAVEAMRGEIEVHDVGHGCVVAVTLPRSLED
jgi:signal transduction histidine kinase